jgi:uncharacterized membrane protein
MNDGMGCLAGFCAVLAVIIMAIYAVSQGVMFVGHGVGTALGVVSWADVGHFLQQLVMVIGILILVIMGLVLAGVAWISYQLDKEQARQAEEQRKRHEIAKPRIPTDLTYEEREGLRNYNTVIRPDFDDLEDLRQSE